MNLAEATGALQGDALVRRLGGFASLGEADAALLRTVERGARPVPAGTDLVDVGDVPLGVFVVLDGFACRYALRASGARQIIALLVPGDLCDLGATLSRRMDHTVATLSPCRVARLTPAAFARLLQRPALARALQVASLVHEATVRTWLVNIGRRDALERLAHLFCELHARLATVGLVAGDGFALPMTQTDLADAAGITPVHANRSIQHLRQAGLITLRQGRLTILDPPRLRALAEFRADYLRLGGAGAA